MKRFFDEGSAHSISSLSQGVSNEFKLHRGYAVEKDVVQQRA
jgi:hypothetical protein